MASLIIRYKTYTTTFPRLSSEEFAEMQAIIQKEPDNHFFPIKNNYTLIQALFKEFSFTFILMLFFGIVLGLFEIKNLFIFLFIPLILWLLLGGLSTLTNFIEDYRSGKRYLDELNNRFPYFINYEDYLYFHKFESLKL